MRKPRDYDTELKVLNERGKLLRERKLRQLGELVIATGADVLPIEELAGALADAAEANTDTKETWRRRGTAFFQRTRQQRGACSDAGASEATEGEGGTLPTDDGAGAR